jgi:outer membrane protein TolC
VAVLSTLVFDLSPIHAETPKLSLHDCIDIALKNQPAIRAAQENVNAGRGRETQRDLLLPQVNASTGYSESYALGGAGTALRRATPRQSP